MADHYKVLGLSKTATKTEIKHAFRKLAVQFHPDKHSQSPKSTKDAATLRFKQVSEAYEVLTDDRKRAAYNSAHSTGNYRSSSYTSQNYRHGGGGGGGGGGSFYRPPPSSKRFSLNLEGVFRYMMTRRFLLNLYFAGMILGGIAAIDMSRETLWKIHNPGKSFEEALDSIEKNKARKDKQ